ncbi:hypothetical protein QJS66_23070 [Kocuria rhizophila]|nr:hypothetical protein QJS66_23070 [Kocuria rhizophila]
MRVWESSLTTRHTTTKGRRLHERAFPRELGLLASTASSRAGPGRTRRTGPSLSGQAGPVRTDSSAQTGARGRGGYGTAGYGDASSSGSQRGSGCGGLRRLPVRCRRPVRPAGRWGPRLLRAAVRRADPREPGYGGQRSRQPGLRLGLRGAGGATTPELGGYPTRSRTAAAQQPSAGSPQRTGPVWPDAAPSPGKGLAIASLVLGILGMPDLWFAAVWVA